MEAATRDEILTRYREHKLRLESLASAGVSAPEPAPARTPVAEPGRPPTGREIEVLRLVSEGLANREIGERLFLSEETIKTHVRNILSKLEALSRAHAVATGFRLGLIA